MKMRLSLSAVAFLLSLGAMTIGAARTQASHTLGYLFNETGTTALADGDAAPVGSPTLNFRANGGAPADLHGGPGSGVSGLAGDRAFDNTTSTGIIAAAHGEHAADFDPIDGLTAFTLAGWFRLPANAAESIGRQAALIENGTISVLDAPGGYRLRAGATADSGTLELRVNRDFSIESSPAYTEKGQWVFFAATYNGAAAANNVQFYKGTTAGSVSLVNTLSLNAGPAAQESIPLSIGVTQTSGLTLGSFSGLIDNVRIWDFVVPQTALESVRAADAAVPEPAAGALAAIAITAVATVRRKTCRRLAG